MNQPVAETILPKRLASLKLKLYSRRKPKQTNAAIKFKKIFKPNFKELN